MNIFPAIFLIALSGCINFEPDRAPGATVDSIISTHPKDTVIEVIKDLRPDDLVSFARTQLGVPYLYASTDPAKGFDCSGFITYVFNHFNVKVPRSSVDFTNYGRAVPESEARPGDLILFTGTDSTTRIVGHMGIIERLEGDSLYFIHSTSGKAKGVVITPLGEYYRRRFVKIIRVLEQ